MKCPFRPVKKSYTNTANYESYEETNFMECYKDECPYYKSFYDCEERCNRVEGESK